MKTKIQLKNRNSPFEVEISSLLNSTCLIVFYQKKGFLLKYVFLKENQTEFIFLVIFYQQHSILKIFYLNIYNTVESLFLYHG